LPALGEVRMETATHFLAAKPEGSAGEKTFWISTRRKTEAEMHGKAKSPSPDGIKPPPDTELEPIDKDKPADPHGIDPGKPRRFRSNAAFAEYTKRLAPLTAARSLGVLPKDKLAGFGFATVGTWLTIDCGGKTTRLEVGERTYGTGQRYVRDTQTKVAYLVDDGVVGDFQSAQFKFLQQNMHELALAEVEEIVVEAKGTQKKLLHRDRKLAERAVWVDASAPTQRNELYGNWLARVERLRVRDYLAQGAEPGSDLVGAGAQVTPVLSVRYVVEGRPKATLDMVRVESGNQTRYYARSDTTVVWVSLFDSTAKEIEQDVGLVVGVDEAKVAPATP
jgi:hypothetical protein